MHESQKRWRRTRRRILYRVATVISIAAMSISIAFLLFRFESFDFLNDNKLFTAQYYNSDSESDEDASNYVVDPVHLIPIEDDVTSSNHGDDSDTHELLFILNSQIEKLDKEMKDMKAAIDAYDRFIVEEINKIKSGEEVEHQPEMSRIENDLNTSKSTDTNTKEKSYRICTADELKRQYHLVKGARVSGCPASDDVWIRLVQNIIPDAKVFVDIGSNKGYTGATFYMLWNQHLGITPRYIYKINNKLLNVTKEMKECGACTDCYEGEPDATATTILYNPSFTNRIFRLCDKDNLLHMKTQTFNNGNDVYIVEELDKLCGRDSLYGSSGAHHIIKVYSFDANGDLVDGLRKSIEVATKDETQSVIGSKILENCKYSKKKLSFHWKVKQLAFVEHANPGDVVSFEMGIGELGHISTLRGVVKGKSVVSVPANTIDNIFDTEKLDHVDILKIDTEGNDAYVLKGARKILSQQKATLVIFELNHIWPKNAKQLLQESIEMLEGFSYVCYLMGRAALVRLTGCYKTNLADIAWSNIWCMTHKTDNGKAIITAFDQYSLAFL